MTRNVLTQDVSYDIVIIVEETQYIERRKKGMKAVDIGKRLVELRGNRSQEQVARDNDISLSAYTKYERGERIPRDEVKIRLAAYYNKSVQEIFFA